MLAIILLCAFFSTVDSCGPTCNPYFLRRNLPQDLRGQDITVVTTNDSSPFVEQAENGVPYGFDIDLLNHISYIYGFNFVLEYKTFQELIPAVQENRYTIAVATHTVTEERIQLVDFAQFFRTGSGFLVRSSYTEEINGIADICGKKVGVLAGSIHEEDVNTQVARCPNAGTVVSSFETFTEILDALKSEETDVSIVDEAAAVNSMLESKGELKVVGEPYDVQPYGIVCNKEDSALCCRLVNAINHLIREGTYKKLLETYSFTMAKNGVCPSRINLDGSTCSSRCTLSTSQCGGEVD